VWTADGLPAGDYEVSAAWMPHPNRASNAPYTIFDGTNRLAQVAVDQRFYPVGAVVHGTQFQPLGTFRVDSGRLRVELTNQADGYVIADAVYLARQGDATPILLRREQSNEGSSRAAA
jgi:hypothetical protein